MHALSTTDQSVSLITC